jgi:hypothetical protein
MPANAVVLNLCLNLDVLERHVLPPLNRCDQWSFRIDRQFTFDAPGAPVSIFRMVRGSGVGWWGAVGVVAKTFGACWPGEGVHG